MNEGLVKGRGEERREGRGGRWNELIEFKKVIKKRERERERESYQGSTSKQKEIQIESFLVWMKKSFDAE
jgi:hypothetical protein